MYIAYEHFDAEKLCTRTEDIGTRRSYISIENPWSSSWTAIVLSLWDVFPPANSGWIFNSWSSLLNMSSIRTYLATLKARPDYTHCPHFVQKVMSLQFSGFGRFYWSTYKSHLLLTTLLCFLPIIVRLLNISILCNCHSFLGLSSLVRDGLGFVQLSYANCRTPRRGASTVSLRTPIGSYFSALPLRPVRPRSPHYAPETSSLATQRRRRVPRHRCLRRWRAGMGGLIGSLWQHHLLVYESARRRLWFCLLKRLPNRSLERARCRR